MRGMRFKAALAALCSTAALLAVGAAKAQSVVLEARGPSAALFPKGKVIPPHSHLDLKPGDVLRIIDSAGVHTLTGGAATGPMSGPDNRLSDIFHRENVRVSQLAAARGVSADPRPRSVANLWDIDVSANVTACVSADVQPSLWRWTADQAQDVEITDRAGKTDRRLTWPAGAQTLDWPADLPDGQGAEYMVRLDDNPPVVVVFRAIQAPAGDIAGLAQELLDKGCTEQFHVLEMATNGGAAS
jgi:hypothetical protein